MEAGRELDVLVAEKIMGFSRFKQPSGQEIIARNAEHAATLGLGVWLWDLVPNYSTDIAATFKVTEKFKEFQMLKVFFPDPPVTRYVASFKRGCEIEAPTMAHAICLAALKAL
jgi:hypothetical protein